MAIAARRQGIVMGHKHKGAAQSVMQLKEQIAGGHARVFVQVAGWFISQNQRRRMHQRPGDCDTLLFTAGKLHRVV